MLIVAIGVTAGTASQVAQKGGLIVLYIGKIFYSYVLPTSMYVLLDLRFNLMIIHTKIPLLFIGLFLATIALLLRGVYYLTMKASHVDGPV